MKKVNTGELFRFVTGMFFPPVCPLCESTIPFSEEGELCPKCRGKILPVGDKVCLKCGRAMEREDREYCEKCEKVSFSFVRCYIVFCYEGELKELLMRFKYRYRRDLGLFFAREAFKKYGKRLKEIGFDALIPIPIHESRFRERGYNQAEEAARELSELLEIPCCSMILVRTKHTAAQKKLDASGRLANLREAFSVDERELVSAGNIKKVLLVDDIFTTGSTMECASEKLIMAGVKEVYGLCISGTKEL